MALANETGIRIADGVYRIGGDDRTAPIFEGAFPVPEGVSYNSYVIMDERTALLDTCDASIAARFWNALRDTLGDRTLDYFVIDHMEPDHGAGIRQILDMYPEVTVVGNARTFEMLFNFYGIEPVNRLVVAEGDVLDLGRHKLRFISAVMVHWPEVMFAYDETDRILFSADAFGTFRTLSGALYADETDFDSEYLDEARRYYSNIVGKYGSKVQAVFRKLDGVPVDMICPLHGPIWREDLGYILGKYDLWSRYEPEEKGVVIAYSTMYGNTAAIADRLALLLKDRGVERVNVYDVTRMHPSYVVSDAFRFTNIVLAAPTYNNGLHPTMVTTIHAMADMAVQGRRYSLIANGSWAPRSGEIMEGMMSELRGMEKVGDTFTVMSAMHTDRLPELEALADAIVASL